MQQSLLHTLEQVENPQLIHYGSFETVFLERMKGRYGEAAGNCAFLDRLIAESVNLLSVIYAKIYFPTYSNGLKEIAQHLGFQWSASTASGLSSLMWRRDWEISHDDNLKQKLITYNSEDCEATERATAVITKLCQRQTETAVLKDNDIVHTDSLPGHNSLRFKDNNFSMPELRDINQAAYWDYQREKIYIKTNARLKQTSRKNANRGPKTLLPVNKTIICPIPDRCPKCETPRVYKPLVLFQRLNSAMDRRT